MHRTQIYLQDDLYEKLKTRSRNAGVSISGLIRRSLEKDIQQDPVADAKAFFERLSPLEGFAGTDQETYYARQSCNTTNKHRSIGEAFTELRTIMREEHYTLETPPRVNRANAFADMLKDELPGGLSS